MPWTKAARIKYQRSGLRYTSDLTDAEWALIARSRRDGDWAGRGRLICARSCRRSSIFCRAAASGEPCRRSSRHTRRFRAIFTLGATRVDGRRSSKLWFGRRAGSLGESPDRQLPSSIARPPRRPRPAGHADSTPASVSMGASAISLPTPTVSCWLPMFIPPTFRMSMVPFLCWRSCETASQGLSMSLPIGFIAASSSSTHSRTVARGQSRSSNDRPGSRASSSCPGAGSSSVPLHGSADVVASPKTSKPLPPPS